VLTLAATPGSDAASLQQSLQQRAMASAAAEQIRIAASADSKSTTLTIPREAMQ
jgi:hypothetical protein